VPKKISFTSKAPTNTSCQVILDSKASQRIFALARDQQEELDLIDDDEDDQPPTHVSEPRIQEEDEEEEDSSNEAEYTDEDVEEEFEIDAADREALDALLPPNSGERKTLADIIFSKLDENSDQPQKIVISSEESHKFDPAFGLDPRVVETFTKMASFLRVYKSGPLPKLFKVIPTFPQWARILALTQPENWSPHAASAATKIFISSMKAPQAQLFLSVVLLDAVREDIRENRKLNYHYMFALKRALYKPAAFFKGIVFPILTVLIFYFSLHCTVHLISSPARLHSERSGNPCLGPLQNENSRPPLLRRPPPYSRNGLLWSQLPLHPSPHRQKISAPVQSRRCPCISFHSSVKYLQGQVES
jgi:essential nuclear protein 1